MSSPRPYVLGLTGSIGMGKSTTSKIFSDLGFPVWDADATVHIMYNKGGQAVESISKIAPTAVTDNTVNRATLKKLIQQNNNLLKQIEAIVHPLVIQSRDAFLKKAQAEHAKLVVIDHPLLLESGSDSICDAVLVVTTNAQEQKRRVMARPDMTEQDFELLLARQMPDADKRLAADYILETKTPEHAQEFVRQLTAEIIKGQTDA